VQVGLGARKSNPSSRFCCEGNSRIIRHKFYQLKRLVARNFGTRSQTPRVPPRLNRRPIKSPVRNARKLFDVSNDIASDGCELPQKTWSVEGSSRPNHIAWAKINSAPCDISDFPFLTKFINKIPCGASGSSQRKTLLMGDSALNQECNTSAVSEVFAYGPLLMRTPIRQCSIRGLASGSWMFPAVLLNRSNSKARFSMIGIQSPTPSQATAKLSWIRDKSR
jgi:hypothetical protein